MTSEETVLLTRYIHSLCPHQAIDEYTPDAWHDVLGHLGLAECRTAVVAIKQRSRFIDPSEIITEVKRARAAQAEHARTEALIGPARRNRDVLTDPRPLRSTIREIRARFTRPEITA